MQTHFRNKWSKVCCPPVQMWLILRLDFPARREQEVISENLRARDACPSRHRLMSAGLDLFLKGLPTREKSAIRRVRQVVTFKVSFGSVCRRRHQDLLRRRPVNCKYFFGTFVPTDPQTVQINCTRCTKPDYDLALSDNLQSVHGLTTIIRPTRYRFLTQHPYYRTKTVPDVDPVRNGVESFVFSILHDPDCPVQRRTHLRRQ